MTPVTEFAAAVQASAEQQIPEEARDSAVVSVHVTEVTSVVIDVGSLDMLSGTDRVALIAMSEAAICDGIDGTCSVSLEERRRSRS